ncbi:MAG: hypothetical protein OXP71_12215 [Candidatus Poribacteria bacterium]|nr:hypothetical protein [Candidatus Poribacteria bacterium]
MKTLIFYVQLVLLIGILIPSLLYSQQNQNTQKSNPVIEDLKQRVSELEKKLQTVENVEKLDLQSKLAEANAKLADAQFGKFERELRDSNDDWLRNWGIFALTFLAVVGASALAWVKSRTKQLIADAVEKNLDGFKEAVEQVDILKKQAKHALEEMSILKKHKMEIEKKDAITALRRVATSNPEQRKPPFPETINALSDEFLLHIVEDETTDFSARLQAAEVLVDRESSQISALLLKILNSAVDRDENQPITNNLDPSNCLFILAKIPTHETYQGLKALISRVLTEKPRNVDTYISETVTSLAEIGVKLNLGDSIPELKLAIPILKKLNHRVISALTEYFDKFNEPEGLKEILTQHGINNKLRYTEEICLRALDKHDSKFVEKWRARKAADESEA